MEARGLGLVGLKDHLTHRWVEATWGSPPSYPQGPGLAHGRSG